MKYEHAVVCFWPLKLNVLHEYTKKLIKYISVTGTLFLLTVCRA